MRRAPDLRGSSASTRRHRWLIGGAAVLLLVLLIALKSLATLYTDELWFSSVGQRAVWNTLLGAKVGLFVTFGGAFFVVLWVNLLVAAHLAAVADERGEPPDELVQRFRQIVAPRSGRIYGGLAVVAALIAASGTIGEWQNWILWRVAGGNRTPRLSQNPA